MQEQLNQNTPNQDSSPTKGAEHINEEYTTHINQLISEPATENIYMAAAQYIFSSLYQLSSYLFTKKLNQNQKEEQSFQSQNEQSLYLYLDEMSEELGKFGKLKAIKQHEISKQSINIQSELIKCYQKVDGIYFQQKYFLDLSYFQLFYVQLKSKNIQKVKKVNKHLEKIIQSLDLVEINLFSQIHCKFHEYFAAAANFQYLQESVNNQLIKLKQSRSRIQLVKRQMVDKSFKLRQMIIKRQNIEKVLKNIKIVKSLKKLPQVIQSILASSLPYQCLQLLQTTKNSIQSVKSLKCLTNTSQSIRNMQSLAQNDLTKRYVNQLYLYLQECHNQQYCKLIQLWKKIQVRNCLDKDNSLVIDQLNSSTESMRSQNQIILSKMEEVQSNMVKFGSKALTQRNQGREYEIAMILLQSFQFITFSPQVIKIKFGNALRIFIKRFQRQLLHYLDNIVKMQIQIRKENEKILGDDDGEVEVINKMDTVQVTTSKRQAEQGEISTKIIEKVTVQFYVKHLSILNDIFRDTIQRLLGYLYTLISEYEEQYENISQYSDKDTERNIKFKLIFSEQCSLLPSIFKIVEEKIKYLLTLKHIRDISYTQYYQWISVLKFWQRFFEDLYQNNDILNYNKSQSKKTTPFILELITIVSDNVKKSQAIMGLRNLLYQLTTNYLEVYHNNTVNNEIITNLQQDTWQSTEVPQQFSDILNNIFNPDGTSLNASITILDLSSTSSKGNMSRQSSRQISKDDAKDQNKVRLKFKLLKNNILVGGVRYKVHLSLIILCQTISEYVKMNRKLSSILPNQYVVELGFNKITKYIYQKIFALIEAFVNRSKQLILECQALKYQKMKAKTINAKHICLLCNSYSILMKISQEIIEKRRLQQYQLQNMQMNLMVLLKNTHTMLTNKLSVILNTKMDKVITQFIQLQTNNTLNAAAMAKINNSIVTAFIQMVQITDDYLEAEDIKKVLKNGFQTLTQKYFTHLLSRGQKYKSEVELFAEKMKFLRKYFVLEYQSLLKEISQ